MDIPDSAILDEVRSLREKFEFERDRRYAEVAIERDRRYAEVNVEKEKALAIKTEADKTALGLQRDVQLYKDEKANNLREQIGAERGTYATKDQLAVQLKPLTDALYSGRGMGAARNEIGLLVVGGASVLGVLITIIFHFIK